VWVWGVGAPPCCGGHQGLQHPFNLVVESFDGVLGARDVPPPTPLIHLHFNISHCVFLTNCRFKHGRFARRAIGGQEGGGGGGLNEPQGVQQSHSGVALMEEIVGVGLALSESRLPRL